MDETEIAEAIASLEEKSLGRIKSTEEKLASIENSLSDLQKGLVMGGGHGASRSPGGDSSETKAALEAGFRELIRGNQSAADAHFAKAMATKGGTSAIAGEDPAGGYLVGETIGAMQTIPQEISPLSSLARQVPLVGGSVYSEPFDRELLAAAWVGETDARPSTAVPRIGELRIEAHEMYAAPKASQQLIDVARISITDWLTSKIQEGFAVLEDRAFFNGDGVSKPRGLLTYPVSAQGDANRAWGTVQFVLSGVDGNFPTPTNTVGSGDPIIDLTMSLKPAYRPNARFMMSRSTAATVRKLKDAQGRLLWTDSLAEGTPDRLCGFPVSYSEQMPAIATDALAIAFGDFARAYIVTRKYGLRMLADPYSEKPYVILYARTMVGGGLANSEAVKFLRFGDA